MFFSVKRDEGTQVYTDYATGVSGGFAVGKYGIAKEMDEMFFSVKRDEGTQVYTDYATGVSGGFAVGKYGIAKSIDTLYFSVNKNGGTRAYSAGVSGGFAVGKYGIAKGMDTTYFNVTPERTDINYSGNGSGTGLFVNQIGVNGVGNLFNVRKDYFTAGYDSKVVPLENCNISIGNYSLKIPEQNKPLIYSSAGVVNIRSTLILNTGAIAQGYSYKFPVTDGKSSQVIGTDGAGNLSWQDNPKDISPKGSNENSSELKEELDTLKKENAQLRKDIEEIKELLKK